MKSRNVFLMFVIGAICLSLFVACSSGIVSGPVEITLIRPTAEHCKYEIVPTQVQTLQNIFEMRGLIGSVVTTNENLDKHPEILDTGIGFKPIDAQFIRSGNVYGPIDISTLFAASLYYAIETGYLLFKNLDPASDLATIVPGFSNTKIIYEAHRSLETVGQKKEEADNAEYLHYTPTGKTGTTLDYFLSYPTDTIKDVPLGINLGILVHEFTHLAFHHLFYEPGFKRNVKISSSKPTENTLAALDEGNADYFGFLAAKDPSYFLCSFPNENRDLKVEKTFTAEVISRINQSAASFDPHEGGAIWAAIQYQIGLAIGSHEENGKSLIKLMSNLLDCPDTNSSTGTLNMDFSSIAKCHEKIISQTRNTSIVHQIYQRYLGSYGDIP